MGPEPRQAEGAGRERRAAVVGKQPQTKSGNQLVVGGRKRRERV